MKKIIKLLGILVFVLFMPLSLFAQVEPPGDISDVIVNFNAYMSSLLGIALVSTFLTGLVGGFMGKVPKWVKRLISWVIPMVICIVVGNIFNIGFLSDKTLLESIFYGLGAGLVSNGIFEISVVNSLIKFIEGLFKKKKTI